jgi:hypothetical protein
MHLTDHSLSISKLFCKNGGGWGGEGFVMNSEGISGGREGGGESHNGPLGDRNRCVMNS